MTAVSTHTVASWDGPATVAPRGTLIVLPGRGEHPAVYERFGKRLAIDAYRVRVVDDPTRDPLGVRGQILGLLDDDALPGPRVLVGSDAGALYAAALVATGAVSVDGLILAGLPVPGRIAPARRPWEQQVHDRTACSAHQARLLGDDDLDRGAFVEPPPAAWFDQADLADVAIPVLSLHGADDRISPLDAARTRYQRAQHGELVTIASGRHDALNDATHRTAAAAVVLFLERLRQRQRQRPRLDRLDSGAVLPVIATTER